MSIWTDLQAAIDAEAIAKGYTGTLAEVGIDQPYAAELITLLELRSKLASGGGSGSAPAITTTSTNVASSATSVSLLAANSDRKFASFRNDSTAIAYIELGATATTSSTYRLDPQGFLSLDNYTGAISCIWASANGFMRVSEGV